MLNKVFLEGNLGRDAELKESQKGGESYAKFSFAVWQGKDKESAWFDVLAFKYTAEAAKSLKKGDKIVVCGKLEVTDYDKKDGTKGVNKTIFAESISLLASKGKSDDPYKDIPNRAPVAKKANVEEDEVAIPF